METGREGNGGREEERSGLVTMYAVNLAGCESSLQASRSSRIPSNTSLLRHRHSPDLLRLDAPSLALLVLPRLAWPLEPISREFGKHGGEAPGLDGRILSADGWVLDVGPQLT